MVAIALGVAPLSAVSASACSRSRPLAATEAGSTSTTTLERATVAATPGDSDAARARLAELVRAVAASGYVKSEQVLETMRRVPRHLFMTGVSLEEAYGDWPFPIGAGQTISQPTVVGEMTEALDLHGTERVLEIGTGSGYQAAILSLLARDVYSIEIVRELGERAKKTLADLGHANVRVRIGDGYAGWPEEAPFDRIILTAAPPEVPKALLDQLGDGGVLVAPVGEQHAGQWLVRIRKNDGKLTTERLEAVRFVPMVRKR